MAYSGKFHPTHPEKYVGNVGNIIYRSGWELKFFRYCDSTLGILQWGSEEFHIPYVSPVDGRGHRYFCDVWMKVQTPSGARVKLIEIKPRAQTIPPKPPKKQTKRYLQEMMTYGVNQAKWAAAQTYCKERGWDFMVITEEHFPSFKVR